LVRLALSTVPSSSITVIAAFRQPMGYFVLGVMGGDDLNDVFSSGLRCSVASLMWAMLWGSPSCGKAARW